MRLVILCLALCFLAPAAFAQEQPGPTEGMCEYHHPAHPGWDFFRACTLTTEAAAGAETTRAKVQGGSTFTVKVVHLEGGSERVSVNGHPASRVPSAKAQCYRTTGAGETICIHPPGADAPVAAAPAADAADVPADLAADVGGGTPGFCLLTARDGDTIALADHGACKRAVDCQDAEDGGGQTCLSVFVWKNGRETGLYRTADWVALDGVTVTEGKDGCVTETASGAGFCFSEKDFTPENQPVLSGPVPAPNPPEATSETETAPAAAAATPAPKAQPGTPGQCRFLKDGKQIAAQACREEDTCTDSTCDTTYHLASGLDVATRVLAGQVVAIDGAPTGPVSKPENGPLCVPYLSSPFIFCFQPD